MNTPSDLINRTSRIFTALPFLQSPEGYRAFLISAGLTDLIPNVDFHGQAPSVFWPNLIWDLWQSGNFPRIEALLGKAQDHVGIDAKEDLVQLTQDWQTFTDKQQGHIYRGDLWSSLPSGKDKILETIRESSRAFLLRYIDTDSSDYIQHSLDHPDRAIEILNNWLLDKEQKEYLQSNNWMIFFLYASFYLYKIGLAKPPTPNQDNDHTQSTVLSSCAERGAFIIEHYWRDLGIEDSFQASILSKICIAHENVSIEDKTLQRKVPYRQTGQLINLQFIVACLRLVSELDLWTTRIPFLIKHFLEDDLANIQSTFVFGGIGPHGNYPETINAYLQCYSPQAHRAFKQHEGHVQILLSQANRSISPRFKYTNVIYDIENIGYEPIDFKFKVEASAALEIFMGTPIYTHPATFLRELIQNALDACQVRRIYEPSLQPKISVSRERDFRTVIVKDNGIGMDKAWVEKYFLPIGISFYRSEEFENIKSVDVGFSPISRFGIGILSCFMIAEKVVIRTKKFGGVGLEMEMPNFRNYFTVRLVESLEQGTEIVLTLKPDFAKLDCLGYMLDNLKFTKYPVEYHYFDGEKRIIAQEPVSLVTQLRAEFWHDTWKDYIETRIQFLSSSSEGYIAFKILRSSSLSEWEETRSEPVNWIIEKPTNAKVTDPLRPVANEEHWASGKMSVCEVHIFQDGIYICNEPRLIPKWMKRNIVCRINLCDEDRVDISISRTGLLQNSKYEELQSKIEGSLVHLLSVIFGQLKSHYHQNIEDYRKAILRFIQDNIELLDSQGLVRLLEKHYCFVLLTRELQIHGFCFYNELPTPEKLHVIHGNAKSEMPKLKQHVSDDIFLIADMDARVLAMFDKDNRYGSRRSLLGWDEKIELHLFLDEH